MGRARLPPARSPGRARQAGSLGPGTIHRACHPDHPAPPARRGVRVSRHRQRIRTPGRSSGWLWCRLAAGRGGDGPFALRLGLAARIPPGALVLALAGPDHREFIGGFRIPSNGRVVGPSDGRGAQRHRHRAIPSRSRRWSSPARRMARAARFAPPGPRRPSGSRKGSLHVPPSRCRAGPDVPVVALRMRGRWAFGVRRAPVQRASRTRWARRWRARPRAWRRPSATCRCSWATQACSSSRPTPRPWRRPGGCCSDDRATNAGPSGRVPVAEFYRSSLWTARWISPARS